MCMAIAVEFSSVDASRKNSRANAFASSSFKESRRKSLSVPNLGLHFVGSSAGVDTKKQRPRASSAEIIRINRNDNNMEGPGPNGCHRGREKSLISLEGSQLLKDEGSVSKDIKPNLLSCKQKHVGDGIPNDFDDSAVMQSLSAPINAYWREIVPAPLQSSKLSLRGNNCKPHFVATASASLVIGAEYCSCCKGCSTCLCKIKNQRLTGVTGLGTDDTKERQQTAANGAMGALPSGTCECPSADMAPAALHPTRINFVLTEAPDSGGRFFIPLLNTSKDCAVWFEEIPAAENSQTELEACSNDSKSPVVALEGESKGGIETCGNHTRGTGLAYFVSCAINLPVRVLTDQAHSSPLQIISKPAEPLLFQGENDQSLEWC